MRLVLEVKRHVSSSTRGDPPIPIKHWEQIKTELNNSHGFQFLDANSVYARVAWLLSVLRDPTHDQHGILLDSSTLCEQVIEYNDCLRASMRASVSTRGSRTVKEKERDDSSVSTDGGGAYPAISGTAVHADADERLMRLVLDRAPPCLAVDRSKMWQSIASAFPSGKFPSPSSVWRRVS